MIKSLIWPANIGKQDGNYKLDRIKNALLALGQPQLKIPFPIHIVGTNGKGSTTAFLESILKEAGFKSHAYTSPNLICLNERIKLAGVEISDTQLIEVTEETRSLLSEKGLEWEVSFFEGFTAAAFLAFSQTKADFSLIEAGLGGRFAFVDCAGLCFSRSCQSSRCYSFVRPAPIANRSGDVLCG